MKPTQPDSKIRNASTIDRITNAIRGFFSPADSGVAKVLITVTGGDDQCLFSRKRADGSRRDNKLELLGGHIDDGEKPIQALLRELGEEEKSGTLKKLMAQADSSFEELWIGGADHYLFRINITEVDFAQVEADPRESHPVPVPRGAAPASLHRRR